MNRPVTDLLAELRAAFAAALTARDARAAAALYAEDAKLLAPAADPVKGREAIEAFWQAGLAAGITAVELEPQALDGDGRLAYELGRYELRLEPADAGPVSERGSYLLVHTRKDDGRWRRAAEMLRPD